ncbi:MAG: hypothetical protein WBL06_02160 [Pseudolysinimonas sp.]|uniref:hypothetical protein n=1 Tax=Pseudolysinimonas sp. TaxID=2680009 RepID=UPI003C7427A7
MPTAPSRLLRLLTSPVAWHAASLVAGLAIILWLQRDQWFFFDEFRFLLPDGPGPWDPHVGHWSLMPTLIYDAYVALFGINSYWPWALTITLLHLAVAHLVWRVCLRAAVAPPIATAAVAVLIVLGSGGENILWGFQIGYVGAIAFGMLAFLLAWDPSRSTPRFLAAVGVSVFSLMWSGTSIPLVVATSAVVWWSQGWKRALVAAVVPGAIYLTWYALFAVGTGPDTGGFGVQKLFVEMPLFLGVLVVLGFGAVFPLIVPGVLVVIAVLIWLVPTLRRRDLRVAAAVPLVLAGAAVVFALLTAYSRASMSVGSGRAGRYVYFVVVLVLPLLAYALTRLLARYPRRGIPAAIAALLALSAYQVVILGLESARQAQIEQHTHRLVSAALALHADDPGALDPERKPDPVWAPDLTLGSLVLLADAGRIGIGDYTDADRAEALTNLSR